MHETQRDHGSPGWRRTLRRWTVLLATCVAVLGVTATAGARTPPGQDPFYQYTGSTPLASIAPGTVLKTRTVPYHVLGVPFPLKTTQLLYRSTGQRGQPTTNVTSVVRPWLPLGKQRLVSYQSFYDSLNPDDEPSYAISGGVTLGGLIPNVETAILQPLLLKGYSVVIPDTEGQQANFAAGREYGYNTLDSLRAALNSSTVGLPSNTDIALAGYSGGAIATGWAAELAPTYAPGINAKIVGSSMGGVLVHPAHNLRYVEGTPIWAGVLPMAVIGIARAFDIPVAPYLNGNGQQVYDELHDASIINALGQYPGLTWASLTKPEFSTLESSPVFVDAVNQLIMGSTGSPTKPMQITQGAGGTLEGTPADKPGIGPGDGVMVAGDVRTLARQYCAAGVRVKYSQFDGLSHLPAALAWYPEMLDWISDRFLGWTAAPSNCSSIAPGNPLDPVVATP